MTYPEEAIPQRSSPSLGSYSPLFSFSNLPRPSSVGLMQLSCSGWALIVMHSRHFDSYKLLH